MKRAKSSVDYSRGKPGAYCGICKHYLGNGECELVAGTINPAMWCRLFEERKSVMAKRKGTKKKPGKGY